MVHLRIILPVIFSVTICSCEYENVSMEVPSVCDTTQLSYSKTIVPIIQSNCYACHSTTVTALQGGLDLENYTSFYAYLNNTYEGDGVFGSLLYHCILKSKGALPMPPGGDKLSDCDIQKIKAWINTGAPNN